MTKTITLMARACLFCRVHMHKHVHLQPAEIPALYRRFAHIHVYLVGLLPSSRSHTYLFTVIGRTSRWPEAIPLPSITATDCARALFAGWIPRFGVRTGQHHLRQRGPVHVPIVGCPVWPAQPQPLYHNCLPPAVERVGGKVPQAVRASAVGWHDHLP
jgi:hypothetical protein